MYFSEFGQHIVSNVRGRLRSDVTPEDANFKAAKAALNGVKSWEPNWDDVAVSLSADIARWHKVTDSE